MHNDDIEPRGPQTQLWLEGRDLSDKQESFIKAFVKDLNEEIEISNRNSVEGAVPPHVIEFGYFLNVRKQLQEIISDGYLRRGWKRVEWKNFRTIILTR
jgi:hypothetical protein